MPPNTRTDRQATIARKARCTLRHAGTPPAALFKPVPQTIGTTIETAGRGVCAPVSTIRSEVHESGTTLHSQPHFEHGR